MQKNNVDTFFRKRCGYTYYLEKMRQTYFFSQLPAPVSRKPLANGLLSILSFVIYTHIHTHWF